MTNEIVEKNLIDVDVKVNWQEIRQKINVPAEVTIVDIIDVGSGVVVIVILRTS